MKYLSVEEVAKKWNISNRSVRNYCALKKIDGAIMIKKRWQIPSDAIKPERSNKKTTNFENLLDILLKEKNAKLSGGIYHMVQIELTYNSNHMEGSKLTHDETRYIFETSTIGGASKIYRVNDIVETVNHFKCIDLVIDYAKRQISEKFIKELHCVLKGGTDDERKLQFAIGDYKTLPNMVGDIYTTSPENVHDEMKKLLSEYNSLQKVTFDDLLDFHFRFECIHPFQDGNGRIGRLLLFKECLKNNIVPFIIDDELKLFYYRGLKEWENEKGYLRDTCLMAQDKFKLYLDYFKIRY